MEFWFKGLFVCDAVFAFMTVIYGSIYYYNKTKYKKMLCELSDDLQDRELSESEETVLKKMFFGRIEVYFNVFLALLICTMLFAIMTGILLI